MSDRLTRSLEYNPTRKLDSQVDSQDNTSIMYIMSHYTTSTPPPPTSANHEGHETPWMASLLVAATTSPPRSHHADLSQASHHYGSPGAEFPQKGTSGDGHLDDLTSGQYLTDYPDYSPDHSPTYFSSLDLHSAAAAAASLPDRLATTVDYHWNRIASEIAAQRYWHNGEEHIMILLILYLALFIFGLSANLSVLQMIRSHNSSLRHANHRMLLNLCLADIAQILTCYPMAAYSAVTSFWHLGNTACTGLNYLAGWAVNASSFSMMFLSLDRYLTINHPGLVLKYDQARMSAAYTAAAWLAAALVALPTGFFRSLYVDPRFQFTFCVDQWSGSTKVITSGLTFAVVYLVPCLVHIGCHWSTSRPSAKLEQIMNNNSSKRTVATTAVVNPLESRDDIRKKAFRIKRQEVTISAKPSSPGKVKSVKGKSLTKSLGCLGTINWSEGGSSPDHLMMGMDRDESYSSDTLMTGTGGGSSGQMSPSMGSSGYDDLNSVLGSVGLPAHDGTPTRSYASKNVIGWSPKKSAKLSSASDDMPATPEKATTRISSMVQPRQIARIRLINLITGLTISFILCWFPYHLLSFYFDYVEDPTLEPWLQYFLLLGHMHCALSPIIFWSLNRNHTPKSKEHTQAVQNCTNAVIQQQKLADSALERNASITAGKKSTDGEASGSPSKALTSNLINSLAGGKFYSARL